MDDPDRLDIHVPPLKITKDKHEQTLYEVPKTQTSKQTGCQRSHQNGPLTPPLTPHASNEDFSPHMRYGTTQFHHYLRAIYTFPRLDDQSSTVTLPLTCGNLILVHSVHDNGWADGTKLEDDTRGWLPTNYCEPYNPEQCRELTKALTNLCQTLQESTEGDVQALSNADAIRGLVAGVRCLLERTNCLSRTDPIIKSHAGLRRARKHLLADLSVSLKHAKKIQDMALDPTGPKIDESDLKAMELHGYCVVLRAVKFLDIWDEEFGPGFERSIDESMAALDGCQTTTSEMNNPLEIDALAGAMGKNGQGSESVLYATRRTSSVNTDETCRRDQANNNSKYSRSSQSYVQPATDASSGCKPSLDFRGSTQSISHRVSWCVRSARSPNVILASEKLSQTHDAFLSFLGSFLGQHLSSRTSSEVLLTIHEAVTSCHTLLVIVDTVWVRDLKRSNLLKGARENMFAKITDLVQAARDILKPEPSLEEEFLRLEDGKNLVDASTSCIRGAGECVAMTRFVLEKIGDFEFENAESGTLGFDGVNFDSSVTPGEPGKQSPTQVRPSSIPPQPSVRPPPPPQAVRASQTLPTIDTDTVKPLHDSNYAKMESATRSDVQPWLSPLSDSSSPVFSQPDFSPVSQTTMSSPVDAQDAKAKACRKGSVDDASTASNKTYIGSLRDSERSVTSSAYTRVESPDLFSSHIFGTSSPNHSFSENQSTFDEDCEETVLVKTFAHELVLGKDGQILGGTLQALIERLTTHDSRPDSVFVSTFYLTFRSFASPQEFARALIDRFIYVSDSARIADIVRLRVFNVFKGWLESHWRHDCDTPALAMILDFANHQMSEVLSKASTQLKDLAMKVSSTSGPLVPRLISSIGKTNTSVASYISSDTPLPVPTISKSQLSALKNWRQGGSDVNILEFDPLEVARQLTIKTSILFCSILPEELLATEWQKDSGSLAVNVRAIANLSTDITNFVNDSILQSEDAGKRAKVLKQWIKIGVKCIELDNYDSLFAITGSLNSAQIMRLKRTWEAVSVKTKASWDELQRLVNRDANFNALRLRLQSRVPPCIPFVGQFLTYLNMINFGNKSTRDIPGNGDKETISVINFGKHLQTAKIISDFQRFQVPHRLQEVPELQTWIQDQLIRAREVESTDSEWYYRRSLLLEPRPTTVTKPTRSELRVLKSHKKGKSSDKNEFLSNIFGQHGGKDKDAKAKDAEDKDVNEKDTAA